MKARACSQRDLDWGTYRQELPETAAEFVGAPTFISEFPALESVLKTAGRFSSVATLARAWFYAWTTKVPQKKTTVWRRQLRQLQKAPVWRRSLRQLFRGRPSDAAGRSAFYQSRGRAARERTPGRRCGTSACGRLTTLRCRNATS